MQDFAAEVKTVTCATPQQDNAVNSEVDSEITTKKIFIRRPEMAGSKMAWYDARRVQLWRHTVQFAFAMLNVYIGVMFYIWVRYYETAGQSLKVAKPTGVEGWLPIAGLVNLKYTVLTWQMPQIHAAAMLLLVAFMLVSLLLKKSFCSWLCPIGTLSEILWKTGKKLLGHNFTLPRWADIPLRGLKYILLSFFIYIMIAMPVQGIVSFMQSPYGIVADVKMLDFFRYAGSATIITTAVLLMGSFFIPNLWCRYLCPYGALMGLLSIFSPTKIRRDANACIDCEKCAKVCPERLPVDQKLQISSPECTACMSCVDICPAKDALQLSLPPRRKEAANGDEQGIQKRWLRRKLSGMTMAWALLLIVGGIILAAKLTGHWETTFSEEMYMRFVPNAKSLGHF